MRHQAPGENLTQLAGPASAPAGRPRLLLLSYHFPPGQAAGALRWEQLTHLGSEMGWSMDVITAAPALLPRVDDTRLRGLPADTRVYGVSARRGTLSRVEQTLLAVKRLVAGAPTAAEAPQASSQPASLSGTTSVSRADIRWRPSTKQTVIRLLSALSLYEADRRWANAAAGVAKRLLTTTTYNAVVSCGPPHMVHASAGAVARRAGRPHVMDLRDPWSLVERLPDGFASPVWVALARHHERAAVARASLIVMNTDVACDRMQRFYPDDAGRFMTVMNGHDEDPLPPPTENGAFVVAYAGAIYLDRSPETLFRAVSRLVREEQLTQEQFRVELMGTVNGFNGLPLEAMVAREGLEGYVRLHPPGSRREAQQFLAGAQVLISLPQDSNAAIPSKVFEYLRFPAWLVALADQGSATAEVLKATSAAVVAPHAVDELTAVLRRHYKAYRSSGRPLPAAVGNGLSRRGQADKYFRAIRQLAETHAPAQLLDATGRRGAGT